MKNQPIIDTEKLLSLLPHGSGIDFKWRIITHKNGTITAKNAFHAMDEFGFYSGIMPFSVRIFRHTADCLIPLKGDLLGKIQVYHRKGDVQFSLSCNEGRKRCFYGLSDYLHDTIHHALHDLFTFRNEIIEAPHE